MTMNTLRSSLAALAGAQELHGLPHPRPGQGAAPDKPTFDLSEPKAITKGGFGELIFRPRGNRWYAVGLYNLVTADRPLLNPRLGGPANIARYETVTAGLGYLLRRNARVFAEGTWDRQAQSTAWTVGLVTAF